MERPICRVLMLSALLAGLVSPALSPAQSPQALFGPKQYARTAGPPNQYTDAFTLPAGATAPFTLHMVNGNADGTHRVSSAAVKLNGTEIAGPSDFGQNVAVLDRPVTLQASNTLEVRLTSAPGSFLTITVLATSAGPQPTGLAPNPLNLTTGAAGTLTATLAPPPAVAGSLTAGSSHPSVATVPASVSFAAGQTTVAIPVSAVAVGTATITVSLNGGTAASQVTVSPPPPTLTGVTPASGKVGDTVTVTGTEFINVQAVTFNGVAAASFTVTSATSLAAVVPAGAATGLIAVTTAGGTATSTEPFTVLAPPVLSPIGNRTVPLGSTLTFTATATDPNHDPVTFAMTPLPLPAHASFHTQTGLFTFTPDETQVGTFLLTVQASDGLFSVSEAITITVTGTPPGGVTSLTGRIDDTAQHPLANLTVSLRGTALSTTTAADGTFTLTSATMPTGRQTLVVDGFAQGFAILAAPVDLIANVSNELAQPLTLPPVDMSTAVTVNPAATTLLTSATLNVTVIIPPNTAKNVDGTPYTGQLTISPVPEYGRPESRPIELRPGLSVTIQPAGVLFDPPAAITFPNIDNMAPNSELHLWSLSPDTGAFNAVALMRVSADGQRVETVSGGVRQSAWHFPMAAGPRGDARGEERGPCTECRTASGGDLREGNLIERVIIPGVRTVGVSRDLTLHYQSTSADVRPILPVNTLQSARASLPNTFSARLTLGGVQQGPDRYWDAHALTPGVDTLFRIGLQLDGRSLSTGVYPYELMVFSNYTQSSIGGGTNAVTVLRNEQASPFGAGWTVEGVDRLYPQPDGRLVVAEGRGGTKLFGQRGRPIVIQSFDVARSATISGVSASFVAGPMFSQAKADLLNPANFGPTGIVPRPVTFRSGVQTLSPAALEGVDLFVLNDMATPLSAGEIAALEQFVAEGGALLEVSTWAAGPRPVLLGAFLGPSLLDPTGEFTPAGLASPLAAGAFGTVTGALVTGPNRAYAVAGLATVIAQNDAGPNVLLLAPGAGFSGLGRAVLAGDEEAFTTGHPNLNNYTVGPNRTVFLNTVAFLAQAPGFRIPPPAPGSPATYQGPANDFSTLTKQADGTYRRRLKDGTTYQFTAQGLQTSVTDRNNNQTTYAYDAQGRLTTIADPTGQVTMLAYDTQGKLSSVTDPAGRVTQLTHDSDGNLVGVAAADGTQQTFTYDPQHRLTQRTDARGRIFQYAYDPTGRFTQATLPTGETRKLVAGETAAVPDLAAGQGTASNPAALNLSTANGASFIDAKDQTTLFETDRFGGVTKQTDALNRVTTIQRDAQANPISITRPNGAVTTMTYDPKGNLLTSTEPAIAATTTFTYEPTFNQVTSITDPLSHTTTITYDTQGNPLTITDADNQVTTFTYDSRGLLLTSTDALNQTTTFTYDALGRLLTTTDPLNRTTTLTYDAAGNVATSTDALNRTTTFAYDAMNRLTTVTDPLNGVTTYTYDGNGNLLTVKDAKNQVTTFTYDSLNRLVSTMDPLGQTETYEYDGNDNLTKRITPKNDQIVFAYDPVNQVLSKTLPGNLITSYTYDSVGNLLTVTDPDSSLTMTYDLANRLLTTSTAGSPSQPAVTLTYTYDKTGNRVLMTDPVSSVGYGYDALNRLRFRTTPPGTGPLPPNLLAAYPADGTANDPVNNQHGTLQGGATFTSGLVHQAFVFDGQDDYVTVPDSAILDSLTSAITVEAWIKPEVLPPPHTTYDLFARRTDGTTLGFIVLLTDGGRLGFVVETTSSGLSLFFTEPLQIHFGQWQHVAVTLEPGSNTKKAYLNGTELPVTAFSGSATLSGTLLPADNLYIGRRGVYPAGDNQHYKGTVEDLRVYNRALTATEVLALADRLRARYAYDALSRRTSLALPNGTQTTYTYDPASQVTNILHQITATSAQINKADYLYNGVGNRTSLTDKRGVQTFGYDNLDRLTSATHPLPPTSQTFAYDAVGNRTTGGSIVNAGNQLTEDAQFTYEYDNNGNQTKKTNKATNNFTIYTYDAENRLTKIEDFPAGNPTPTMTSTYRYDGLGRRIEKVTPAGTHRYIYDGEDILLEYDATNTLVARYTHGPGIDEPIAVTKGSSTFFYHQDGLGTVTDLTDSAGATAKSYAYDAWGNILDQTGTVEQPYSYTGREFDSESGLYYYRARYYDSAVGRFVKKDPIGFSRLRKNSCFPLLLWVDR